MVDLSDYHFARIQRFLELRARQIADADPEQERVLAALDDAGSAVCSDLAIFLDLEALRTLPRAANDNAAKLWRQDGAQ